MFRRRLYDILRLSSQSCRSALGAKGISLKKLGAGSVFGVLFYTAAAKSTLHTQSEIDQGFASKSVNILIQNLLQLEFPIVFNCM